MSFEVPDLPYDYSALEPYIDEETMRIHHDKHHAAYVNMLNGAVEAAGIEGKTVEELMFPYWQHNFILITLNHGRLYQWS